MIHAHSADTHSHDTHSHDANSHDANSHDAHSGGDHDHDAQKLAEMITQEYWDDRYGSAAAVWSGNPNQRVVEQVAELAPGTALEIGSGEGADTIWLAARGWHVTAVDISTVALHKAAQHAAAAGPGIAARITWQQADLLSWRPGGKFDLVTAHFMHLPSAVMRTVHSSLAAAVRPGGTLLIVGHHPSDMKRGRPDIPDMFYTAEEIAARLNPGEWEIVVAASPEREISNPDGGSSIMRDAVMRAVRR